MMRHLVFPFAAVLAFACGATCFADDPESHNAHAIPQPANQAAAHLVVDAVLPGPLARGVAVLPFRIENMKIMPLYGPTALDVAPRIGHLHITVDGAPWHWVHADNEPIVIQGLAAGLHHITVDLADPIHRVVESKTVSVEIP